MSTMDSRQLLLCPFFASRSVMIATTSTGAVVDADPVTPDIGADAAVSLGAEALVTFVAAAAAAWAWPVIFDQIVPKMLMEFQLCGETERTLRLWEGKNGSEVVSPCPDRDVEPETRIEKPDCQKSAVETASGGVTWSFLPRGGSAQFSQSGYLNSLFQARPATSTSLVAQSPYDGSLSCTEILRFAQDDNSCALDDNSCARLTRP
jgi:hypothetical protein